MHVVLTKRKRINTKQPYVRQMTSPITVLLFQRYPSASGKIGKVFFDHTDPLMPENEETYAEYRETSGES